MKLSSEVLSSEDIMKFISKQNYINWCVFIYPKDVKDFIIAIKELNLSCDEHDLFLGNILMETYNKKQESKDRVMKFRNEWLEQFYVCCYKNGVFVEENT